MRRALLNSFGSWNIVSFNGGADDDPDGKGGDYRTFSGVLAKWYLPGHLVAAQHPEPWLVNTNRQWQDCPNVNEVYVAADRSQPTIRAALRNLIEVALSASPGVRFIDMLYPYVLPKNRSCSLDVTTPAGWAWHGTSSTIDLLNKAHEDLRNEMSLDATRLMTLDLRDHIPAHWGRGDQFQRTMYYGFPHVNEKGQQTAADVAVDLILARRAE
jgi:hypothetical protein